MADNAERWLPVVGEPEYLLSDQGRLWSSKSGRIIKGARTREGYTTHEFGGRLARSTRRLHCMVLEAFVGPRPEGHYACHDDGDPANNRLSNLRWDTPAGNCADKRLHGTNYNLNKVTCARDHLLEGNNLIASDLALGKRNCRACNNAQSLALLREHRGQAPIDVAAYADQKYAEYMDQSPPGPPTCGYGHQVVGKNALRVTKPGGRINHRCRACAGAKKIVERAAGRGVETTLVAEADRLYRKYMDENSKLDQGPDLHGAA